MFIGTFYHTLEANGRLSLPKKFREETNEWVISRGLDGGLFVFTKEQYLQELNQLQQSSFTKKGNRDFIRLLTNETYETTSDPNGRIQLPEYLITRAQLKKDVVIVGSFSRLEIWDRDAYHTYFEEVNSRAEEIAEQVG